MYPIFLIINLHAWAWKAGRGEYKPLPKAELPPYYKNDAWIDGFFKNKPKGSIEDWLKPSPKYNIKINTNPWYMDITTWLWVAGVATTLGACYVGYQFFSNPLFIQDGSRFSFLQ